MKLCCAEKWLWSRDLGAAWGERTLQYWRSRARMLSHTTSFQNAWQSQRVSYVGMTNA